MGTDDVARDMDTIRIALGEDQINYLGVSYGTLIGLRYAALFPASVRAMVLDGVDKPQSLTDWLRGQTTAFETQIDAVFARCPDGQQGCPPGGAAAAYDRVAAMVETTPLPAGKGGTLGPSELALGALLPTYDPTLSTTFFTGLTDALGGDGSRLRALFDAYAASVKFVGYAAVECTDAAHPVGSADYATFAHELEAISPRFGGAVANELLPCAFWAAPVHDITAPVTAPAAPPILVIGNTGDAATPYQQAVEVAQTLAHGRLLTFDSTGHAAYGRSTCAAAAEAAYFTDLTLPDDGTVCDK
jgi:pimeloyl-ACP methyl ester carboxylesterase